LSVSILHSNDTIPVLAVKFKSPFNQPTFIQSNDYLLKKTGLINTMNSKFKLFLSAALVCTTTYFVQAQTDAPATTRPDAATTATKPHHGSHNAQLEKDLNLTEEQKAHFKKVNSEFREKEKADHKAKAEQRQQRHEARDKELKSKLTPEQAAKYDQIMAEKKTKRHEQKGEKRKERRKKAE